MVSRSDVQNYAIKRGWNVRFPGLYLFWSWVIMPRSDAGRLGLVRWVQWMLR